MARKKSRTKNTGDFFFTFSFVIITSIMIGLFVGYLWIHNAVTSTIKENMALRHMETQLENRNKELNSAISQLSRGDRIKRIARDELQMVIPEPESLAIFVEPEQHKQTH